MTRIPVAMAGLALVAVTAVACGDDDGDDTTANDPGVTSSSTASPSVSDSPAATDSALTPTPSTDSGDPVPSPVINKAVKAAIEAGFPALVPSGVPAGWTVVSAHYAGKGGGVWQIALTDPDGAPVSVMQSTASSADLAAQALPDGQSSGSVRVSGTGKWTLYAGSSGTALAKDLSGTGAVVVGPDQVTVLDLAQQLLTAEDGGDADGG